MRAAGILAWNSGRELLRTRFLPVVVLFGGVLVYLGLLVGALAGDVEPRVLYDVAMAVIELMSCGAVAYCAATGLIQEMEQKTLYLILSRPVPRWAFLLGRALGAMGAAAAAAVLMAACAGTMLAAKGGLVLGDLALGLWGAVLKAVVTAAAATLLALVSTSVLSAMTMTGILWVLGHFTREIRFLSERGGAAATLLAPASWVVPRFDLLNYADRAHLPGAEPLAWGLLYALAYSAACLGLTMALFRRREF